MVEELTDIQQNMLHQDLLTLRVELQELLDQSAEQSKPVDLDKPIGRLSRMDEMQQQSMAQANRHATRQRLLQIGAAIGRIDRDEYGLCICCEEDIGIGRLKARPEAPLCLACQAARENNR